MIAIADKKREGPFLGSAFFLSSRLRVQCSNHGVHDVSKKIPGIFELNYNGLVITIREMQSDVILS